MARYRRLLLTGAATRVATPRGVVLNHLRAARPAPGRMRVILNVHGGQQGLANVLEGLVQRNTRAIREGAAPPYTSGRQIDSDATAWRDAPMAQYDGYVSNKTAAAWAAATLRAKGKQAWIGFRNGLPAVYGPGGQLLKVFPGPDVGYLGPTEGRSDERMIVTIDDDMALPVREINQAIARHNAKRIREKGLPPLYLAHKQGKVKYKTEGSPELWWDAEEILRNGHDDCEGLSAYRAGELMLRGIDARVHTRLVQQPSKEMGGSGKPGGRLFHAVVKIYKPDGSPMLDPEGFEVFDDPSRRTGMPCPSWYMDFARRMRAQGKNL